MVHDVSSQKQPYTALSLNRWVVIDPKVYSEVCSYVGNETGGSEKQGS